MTVNSTDSISGNNGTGGISNRESTAKLNLFKKILKKYNNIFESAKKEGQKAPQELTNFMAKINKMESNGELDINIDPKKLEAKVSDYENLLAKGGFEDTQDMEDMASSNRLSSDENKTNNDETANKYSVSNNDIELDKHLKDSGSDVEIYTDTIQTLIRQTEGRMVLNNDFGNTIIGKKLESVTGQKMENLQFHGNQVHYTDDKGVEHQFYYDKKSGEFINANVKSNDKDGFDVEIKKIENKAENKVNSASKNEETQKAKSEYKAQIDDLIKNSKNLTPEEIEKKVNEITGEYLKKTASNMQSNQQKGLSEEDQHLQRAAQEEKSGIEAEKDGIKAEKDAYKQIQSLTKNVDEGDFNTTGETDENNIEQDEAVNDTQSAASEQANTTVNLLGDGDRADVNGMDNQGIDSELSQNKQQISNVQQKQAQAQSVSGNGNGGNAPAELSGVVSAEANVNGKIDGVEASTATAETQKTTITQNIKNIEDTQATKESEKVQLSEEIQQIMQVIDTIANIAQTLETVGESLVNAGESMIEIGRALQASPHTRAAGKALEKSGKAVKKAGEGLQKQGKALNEQIKGLKQISQRMKEAVGVLNGDINTLKSLGMEALGALSQNDALLTELYQDLNCLQTAQAALQAAKEGDIMAFTKACMNTCKALEQRNTALEQARSGKDKVTSEGAKGINTNGTEFTASDTSSIEGSVADTNQNQGTNGGNEGGGNKNGGNQGNGDQADKGSANKQANSASEGKSAEATATNTASSNPAAATDAPAASSTGNTPAATTQTTPANSSESGKSTDVESTSKSKSAQDKSDKDQKTDKNNNKKLGAKEALGDVVTTLSGFSTVLNAFGVDTGKFGEVLGGINQIQQGLNDMDLRKKAMAYNSAHNPPIPNTEKNIQATMEKIRKEEISQSELSAASTKASS